ncbi:hypothetical protein DXT99_19060 [Pontibacter diazotrophicus]|uniref:Uncharacterized protein n=1 Tax=Pontibacter diazotrophicus TaxID=1400979 RepID=A0A3D8L8A3_9BACT|nr:hypothetical protein DXT99_19060 [Pontibacter diazotrophicus]
MENQGSQEAVMQRLGISLSKGQSAELYHKLCNFLVAKDTYAYIDLLRIKNELLVSGVSHRKCDYMTMGILLEKLESEYPLIISAVTYVVKYKS